MTAGIRIRRLPGFLFLCLGPFAAAQAATAAQPAPSIALDPAIECWYHSEFPILAAMVTPPDGVVRSRLYFRCSLYPDYYFVDLESDGGAFRGVAPQAEESCPQVHYYVEALGSDFASTRTEERIAEVSSPDECRRRFPAAVWFAGDDPNILLGSLGTTGLAPGFKSVGVAGFISSTGTTVALGAAEGGISTGVVAGVAAGGAAAAAAGVLASGGGSSTTTTAPAGPPPATSTTTTAPPGSTTTVPAPSGLRACFTLDPPNGQIQVNESLRIDGRCSEGSDLTFHYDLGDGRTKDGQAFVTAIWPNPGNYTLTLTVTGNPASLRAMRGLLEEDSVSRQIQVTSAPPPPTPPPPGGTLAADFVVRNLSPDLCVGEFDGSPSQGNIVRYAWELDLQNAFGSGVVRLEGRVVQHDWGMNCYRAQGNLQARLTVFGAGGNQASVQKTVNILGFVPSSLPGGSFESSFSAEILESATARGRIAVQGGPSFELSGEAPAWVRYGAKRGRSAVEVVAISSGEAFLWRIDFSGARGFVPGSLKTTQGQEVARDAYSVTLRFSGTPMERSRVEYELEP